MCFSPRASRCCLQSESHQLGPSFANKQRPNDTEYEVLVELFHNWREVVKRRVRFWEKL
jgi:hypothetical protein